MRPAGHYFAKKKESIKLTNTISDTTKISVYLGSFKKNYSYFYFAKFPTDFDVSK